MTYTDETPTRSEDQGFKIAVMFFGFTLVVAVLFALYFLLWDGGGTMS